MIKIEKNACVSNTIQHSNIFCNHRDPHLWLAPPGFATNVSRHKIDGGFSFPFPFPPICHVILFGEEYIVHWQWKCLSGICEPERFLEQTHPVIIIECLLHLHRTTPHSIAVTIITVSMATETDRIC